MPWRNASTVMIIGGNAAMPMRLANAALPMPAAATCARRVHVLTIVKGELQIPYCLFAEAPLVVTQ
jgi:hypothetical protein